MNFEITKPKINFKKMLCGILAFVLAFACLQPSFTTLATYSADYDYDDLVTWGNVGGIYLELNDDGTSYYVYGCSSSLSGEVVIPDTFNGLPITRIRGYAFEYCSDITSVVISGNIEEIGYAAFYECENLETATIGAGVTTIEECPFLNCYGLEAIYVDSANSDYVTVDGVLFNKDKTTLVQYPANKAATSYSIPGSVTLVGYEGFRGCRNLKTLTIPANLENMECSLDWNCLEAINVNSANAYYTSVDGVLFTKDKKTLVQYPANKANTSYVIPNGVEFIGSIAFGNCSNLTSVTIPDGVTEIGYSAFNSCANLTSISIPDSVITIENYAFSYTGYYDDESNWVDGVLYIGNHLIEAEDYIDSYYAIKDGTVTIAEGAFQYCDEVETIVIPDSVISIGNSAFSSCWNLSSVSIGSGLQYAGYWIFSGCNNLADITIGDGVSCIDYYCISDTLYCEDSENWDNDALYIGNILITVSEDVSTSYEIKNGTTTIAKGAFTDAYYFNSIRIPDSLTTIGDGAFEYTDINSIFYDGTEEDWGNIEIGEDNSVLSYTTIHYDVTDIDSHWVKDEEESNCTEIHYVCSCGYDYYTNGEGHEFEGGSCVVCGLSKFQFELNDDCESYSVIGCEESVSGEIEIPEIYQGLPVTAIDDYAFSWCYHITSVIIPDSVTSIGEEAFYYCSSLATVEISAGVSYIGENAFYGCDSLREINVDFWNSYYSSVDGVLFDNDKSTLVLYPIGKEEESYTIPYGVTTIGEGAFSDCENLTSIEIPDSVTTIGRYAFDYCSNITSITIPDSVTEIGRRAFGYCTSLQSVSIGDGVTIIPTYAFRYCYNLTDITFGSNVLEIGESAFYECYGLEAIELPDSLNVIGEKAFSNCESLSTITIPCNVTSIGDGAFNYCFSLEAINVDSANGDYTAVNGVLFNKDKTKLIVYPCGKTEETYAIPNTVTEIGDSAFYNCGNLTSIVIPNSVLDIDDYAFSNCSELTTVKIGNGVTRIGDYAFYDCTSLTTVTMGNNVKTIGYAAFSCCYNLAAIALPDGLETIGDYAFESCSSLTEIVIPDSVTSIGEYAFNGCDNLVSITISENLTCIDESTFYGTGYYNDESNWDNNVLYIGTHLVKARRTLEGEYIIKSGTTSISDSAFYNCKKLTGIAIPDTVVRIGESAFMNCQKLTSVSIPDSVTYAGRWAFDGCTGLVEAYIGSGIEDGYSMFSDCYNLETVTFADGFNGSFDYGFINCEKLETVNVPDTVTELSYCEFVGCESLDDIAIPETLVKIESHALDDTGWFEAQEEGDLYFKQVLYGYKNAAGNKIVPENYTLNIRTGTKGIAHDAFEGNGNLVNVVVPDTMEYIGDGSFRACESLMSVTVPSSVTYIGSESLGYLSCWDKISDFTIYGEYGTAAEIYADENEFRFMRSACTHVASDWIVDVQPTCTTAGSKHKSCTLCGEQLEIATIDAVGHTVVRDEAVDATCTQAGKTAGSHCSVCNEVLIAQQTVPAKGHTEVKDAAVAPTCTATGKTEGKHCSVCNTVIKAQETVEAKGHKASEWITDKKATVNAAGSKHQKCTECGEVLKTAKIKQLKCATPKLKSVANVGAGVKVTWTKVKGADNYEVYRKTGSGKWIKIATVKGTASSYVDKKAKSGTTYKYTVKAKNEAGVSGYNIKGLSIKCVADPVLKTPTSTKKGITLKWNKVTGAQGYVIYRKAGNGKFVKLTTIKGASKVSYVDKSAKKGTKYTYKLKAYSGKTYSEYSNGKTIKDKY